MKLHDAVQRGNLNETKKLLRSINVNERDQYHRTPLHIACTEGFSDIVKLLLRKKADPNVQDRNGWTPLHCAASAGHLEICGALLTQVDCDAGFVTKDGTSALHYLIRFMPKDDVERELYKDVMALYVDRRGDLNAQSKHGETALHQACQRGNQAGINFLLDRGAMVNLSNKFGETPLHYAVRARQKEMITMLMEKGADPNLRADEGTALEIAQSFEILNLLKQYLKKDPSVSQLDAEEEPEDKVMKVVDLTEFKLKVKVVRAHNLVPLTDSDAADPICQIIFGNTEKRTSCKSDTLNPKWGENFFFAIDDPAAQLKILVYDQSSVQNNNFTKEELLGSIVLSLAELELDTSGVGTPLRAWYTLKRRPRKSGVKSAPKIRVELSCVPKAQADEQMESLRSSGSEPEKKDVPKLTKESSGKAPNLAEKNVGTSMADLQSQFAAAKGSTMLSHSWELDSGELTFVDRLGEGASAKVFRGTYRGQDVAIKVLKEQAEAKGMDEFKKEFDIMSSLRSPHVVFFFGACIKPSLCMVLEFCSKGALFDCLQRPSEVIDWRRVLKASSDMTRGMSCLHGWKPQIVHRDMKSLNLLVDDNWAVKVSDFGLSRFTSGESNLSTLGKLRGTYAYCAPEVYFGQQFTTKSDVFSVGVIIWELVYRAMKGEYQQPYSEYTQIVFDFQIIIQTAKKGLRPTIPEGCPESIKKIIQICWDPEPEKRPECSDVMEMLKKVEDDYYDNKREWDALLHDGGRYKPQEEDGEKEAETDGKEDETKTNEPTDSSPASDVASTASENASDKDTDSQKDEEAPNVGEATENGRAESSEE